MNKNTDKLKKLLGKRVRTLRKTRGWTQQKLGEKADISYKFLGEIERGQQNPSFEILVKIAQALDVDLPEFFRLDQETKNRNEMECRINEIIKSIKGDELRQIFTVLKMLFPTI